MPTTIERARQDEHTQSLPHVNTRTLGAPEIGVEFAEANPRFYRVSFPPPEWNTRSLEAKRFATGRAAAVVVPPPVKVPAPKK